MDLQKSEEGFRKKAEVDLLRRAEDLAALQTTVLEITALHDLNTLLQTIIERAAQLLGAHSGGLYLCDPARGEVHFAVGFNTPSSYSGTILHYGEGAAGIVAQTGKPLIIDDYRIRENHAGIYEGEQPFSAVLSAPMIWQDQVTGVIDILADTNMRRFTDSDLSLLTLFANHAAIAVENTRLYENAQNELAERKRVEQQLRESEASLHGILRSTADGLLGVSGENEVLLANQRLVEMWRIPPAVMAARDDSVFFKHFLDQLSDPQAFLKKIEKLYQSPDESLDTLYLKDGRIFEQRSRPLLQEAEVRGRVWSFHDITERKQAEQALQQAEAKYRNIVDNAIEGIFQSTPEGKFFTANAALARMLGYDSSEELITGVGDFAVKFYVEPGRRSEFMRQLNGFGKLSNFESEVYRKDGSKIWISENARAVHGAAGQLHYEGTLVDITERKKAEEGLRIAEANYRSLFENSPVGIYQTSPEGCPLAVNQALARIVGFDSPRELLASINSVEQQFYLNPAARREFQRLIETHGQVREFVSQGRRLDGGIIWVQESARVVKDADGNSLYYEGFLTDITERKQAEEELRRQSTHDTLTGLYTRGFFMGEMARLERGRQFPVSILMADVDNLKKTNDLEGHAAGDALLKRVAQVLTVAFRTEDVLARIGGDEFAVLLPGTDASAAQIALRRVRQMLQEHNAAYAGTPLRLSIGTSTADAAKPVALSEALKEADSNMYHEKRGNESSEENRTGGYDK